MGTQVAAEGASGLRVRVRPLTRKDNQFFPVCKMKTRTNATPTLSVRVPSSKTQSQT